MKKLPSTVTLLVTTEQAKVLAGLEQESELHLALVYRGAPENADEFIAAQDALIEELYAEPEAGAAEGAENAESAETEESEGADPAAESEAAGGMNFIKGSLFRRNTEPEELEPVRGVRRWRSRRVGKPGCGKTLPR